jgi:hypothetical protein
MRAVRLELLEGMDLIKSSAKGAKYKSQGRAQSASPLVYSLLTVRPERPKYISPLSGLGAF